jgi:anaerobic selenocysteine-containing dehydrogenase
LAEVVFTFIRSLGGTLYFYDPAAELSLRYAARRLFGTPEVPQHDLAQADFLLSFGAPFLEPWLSPVSFGIAFGHMRQGRRGRRGRFLQIEPRLSLTAANADQWIPIKPGTEGLLALGIGQVLLSEGRARLPKSQLRLYENFYGSVALETVGMETEIPLSHIKDMARAFADAESPLAIGGGPACAHTNAFETQAAIQGLNALVDNINRPGGIRWYTTVPGTADLNVPSLSERHFSELARASEGRQHSVLLLYDCNPLFTVPPTVPVRRLFDTASFIASFSSSLDESSAMADLILPDHSRLETWGDHVQDGASPHQTASLIQPVVAPLYDTRGIGDTILELARYLRPHELTGRFSEILEQRWQTLLRAQAPGIDGQSPSMWERHVQQGGWWSSTVVEQKLKVSFPSLVYPEALFDGTPQEFPFFFHPYPSPALGHGRSADIPWLQELPDAMTSALWGTWIEVNPKTAQAMDIKQGDLVRLQSRHGSIEAAAVLYPGLRPDVIAMPIGQGHTNYGRYANHRGTNPLSILAPLFDKESGALASGGTRIRLEPLKVPGKLIRAEQPGSQSGNELLSIERNSRRNRDG